jgi:hypothetical protein
MAGPFSDRTVFRRCRHPGSPVVAIRSIRIYRPVSARSFCGVRSAITAGVGSVRRARQLPAQRDRSRC